MVDTSRLVRELREERSLVSPNFSNMTQRLQGTFYISASVTSGKFETVEAAIAQHIRTIQTELVTEVEFAPSARK